MIWKNIAKKSSLLNWVNSKFKSYELKRELAFLSQYYDYKATISDFTYNEESAIEHFKCRHLKYRPDFIPVPKGELHVFWVGTNKDQDESGFLQALHYLTKVSVFHNIKGNYGSWSGDETTCGVTGFFEVRRANDEALLNQINQARTNGRIDLLIGQMWAHRISKDALKAIQALGIPVINIAMDDRLPRHWSTQHGVRLGAIGLGSGVDMTLTTCKEVCKWYGVEGFPSIYWPLASDPVLFKPAHDMVRDIDVLFIGNKYGVRAKIISALERYNIRVQCYGDGWINGYVNSEQNIALSRRARIILGVGTVGHCDDVYTLKLRDFDAMMTGALYLTHRNPDLCRIFNEGEEIEYYETVNEAASKIRYYLNHPVERERIGRNGQLKAIADHSWIKRIESTFLKLNLLKK